MHAAPALTERLYETTQALGLLPAAGRQASAAVNGPEAAVSIAGVATTATAKDALTWAPRPPTPETLKPYQHYARQPPGAALRHFGTCRDPLPPGPFGSKPRGSQQSAAECIHHAGYPGSQIARWQLEHREAVYATTRQEPLGRTVSRGYSIPAGLGSDVAYGKPMHVREQEAKNSTRSIIFPEASSSNEAASHQLYVASHGSYEPGEQRSRQYDWSRAGIDPGAHRFGRTEGAGKQCSMQQLLQPGLEPGAAQPQQASPIYERHRATSGQQLGRPRMLGAGPAAPLPPEHVYGRPSAREQEPCVGELIRGCFGEAALQPDPGLGKSLREGWRNTQGAASPSPSMHSARAAPARSEPTAWQLLSPLPCGDVGVHEEHLLEPRSREQLQQLLEAAGVVLCGNDEFEAVFAAAAAAGDGEHCSVRAFSRCRHERLKQLSGLT